MTSLASGIGGLVIQGAQLAGEDLSGDLPLFLRQVHLAQAAIEHAGDLAADLLVNPKAHWQLGHAGI